MELPIAFKADIEKAIRLLKAIGCSDIYIFGSVADGTYDADSDIDIAVKGCPADKFFSALGRLILDLDHPVDLIDLDRDVSFAEHLQHHEDLVRVA